MMEGGDGGGGDTIRPVSSNSQSSEEKRKMEEVPEEEDEGDVVVQDACVVEGSKHRDGSIYRHNYTRETHLMPLRDLEPSSKKRNMTETDMPEEEEEKEEEEEETDMPEEEEEEEEDDEEEEEDDYDLYPDGVQDACVVEGSKHRDGSIYRQDTHFCHRLYRLNDNRETLLKPTNLSTLDTRDCRPHWTNCTLHDGCHMMQIFSLKLAANHAAMAPAAPIQLYGFMAVRDLLQPLRNYVFNRTRDDPLVLHPDPDDPTSKLLMQMTGPKRGIYLQARALIEFDMRIKMPGHDDDNKEDLELIDGAATFSEMTVFEGPYTQRIHGDGGAAVDLSLALLRNAVEARIKVMISKPQGYGMRLSLACVVSNIPQEILIFDGVVDQSGDLVKDGFVVAVEFDSPLVLDFKVRLDGSHGVIHRICTFPAKAHGVKTEPVSLDVAAAKVQVTTVSMGATAVYRVLEIQTYHCLCSSMSTPASIIVHCP